MKPLHSTVQRVVSTVALLLAATSTCLAQDNQSSAASTVKVTPETYIRAETDRQFSQIIKMAGSVNKLYHFRVPTPLDKQNVVRMNRDTLYSMGVVDTSKGATITVPELPEGRYASVYLVDNDHYCPGVIYTSGTHQLPTDTKYLGIGIRIKVFDPTDPEEIALVNSLQDQFIINAASSEPLPPIKWEPNSLKKLTAEYEKESAKYSSWKGMMGPRGKVNEKTRHVAAAAAWGLFPEEDATYLNYSGKHDTNVGYKATYQVPANEAFWSITIYGNDGFMKSENCIVNSSNVKLNDDGTFTVHFGSREVCGDVPNRVDVTEGWNFLMRVYRPGAAVLDGSYKLPEAEPMGEPINSTSAYASPADFGVTDYAYKVSETDFNIKRSLAKASINQWAHQSDVSRVKTQQVIRENQDVIYSSAVVDCGKGATFTVPESDTYHIIEIIDMQNYIVDVVYPGKSITVTPDNLTYGNYVYLNMRVRILPGDHGGLEETLKLQKQASIKAESAIPYQSPDIVISRKKMEQIRQALIAEVQAGKLPDTSNAQGTPYRTNPWDHLLATAYGWGGLSIEHAAYLPLINKSQIEGDKPKPSSVTLTPPEIDLERGGFWSITTYNAEGWLAKDEAAISNTQATPNDDGTYTIHFNSPGKKNNVNTSAPFTALLRIYVPKSKDGVIKYLQRASNEFVIE